MIRKSGNYDRPDVIPSCPGQCSSSFTFDYTQYCTCPILYFILSPKYICNLPHFNGNFYSGHLVNKYEPTDPTMVDPTVTPYVRYPRKVTLLGLAQQVCVFFFYSICLRKHEKKMYTYFSSFFSGIDRKTSSYFSISEGTRVNVKNPFDNIT